MDMFFLCFLGIFLAVSPTAASAKQLSGLDVPNNDKGLYLQLLRRVENLENRDKEQQAEITMLRSELNTEKQKTSSLEEKIFWLELNVGKHETGEVKTTADDDLPNVKDTSQSTTEEKAPDIRSQERPDKRGLQKRRQEDIPVVAFHATVSRAIEHVGVHQSIAFDNVITNIGAAYNPHYGSFVAPVPGVYVFSATLMGYGSPTFDCYIVKNGSPVAHLHIRGSVSPYGNDSAMVVLHLDKGDDVAVENLQLDKAIHGYAYSMFSGFLLHKDSPSESIVGKK